MKSCCFALSILTLLLSVADATAQVAGRTTISDTDELEGDETRRYRQSAPSFDDSATAVRRKAEFRSQQRRGRIAAMKWYGYSNSRPTASASPFMGAYSPEWSSNTIRPFNWSVGGRRTINIYPNRSFWW